MGLDMYLSAKKFASGYDFVPEDKRKLYNDLTDLVEAKGTSEAPFAEVSVTVGYWRKANAIHGWFVRELADGKDECQAIYAPRTKLVELRDLCKTALANKPKVVVPAVSTTIAFDGDKVQDIGQFIKDAMTVETHNAEFNDEDDDDPLRPIGGFFFGSTNKDDWYYEDLESTVEILDHALTLDDSWSFEYRASW